NRCYLFKSAERLNDFLTVLVEDSQRFGKRFQGPPEAVLVVGQNRREPVESVDGSDYVGDLIVQSRRELGQPRHQICELAVPAGDGPIGLVGNILQRTQVALVAHASERGKHFLGGWEAAGSGLLDGRAVDQPARRRLIRWRRQLDVLRTKQ